MISTSEFKKGIILNIDSQPWLIVDYEYVNPGKGAAFFRTKLRNLKTGKFVEQTFKSGDKFEELELELKKAIYLYSDRQNSVFKIEKTEERVTLPLQMTEDKVKYLKQGFEVNLVYIDEEIASLNIPPKVDLKVIESPPDFKGNTVSGSFKTVKLENGLKANVPIFIKEGEIVKINTETGAYSERVNE